MKFVIQRVSRAQVSVNKERLARIEQGLLVLVGMEKGDTADKLPVAVSKLTQWRLFEGPTGKPSLSLLDGRFELLLVSQFTLCATLNRGRRPDFTAAMPSQPAQELYVALGDQLLKAGARVAMGAFGQSMQVDLCNEGPFTLTWQL